MNQIQKRNIDTKGQTFVNFLS